MTEWNSCRWRAGRRWRVVDASQSWCSSMSDRHVKNDLGVALVLGGAILLVVIGVAMNGQITPALNAPALTVETFWEWSLYTVKVIAVMVLAGVGLTNL